MKGSIVADVEKKVSPQSLQEVKTGQKLVGKITKTELFGAFVDVGLEREGMIHISMLKQGRVNRVEDVVDVGDEVEVWVHRVDPNSGRLELTMIKPVEMNWKDIRSGMRVKGKVVRLESFGAFVDIGAERPGLVHVSEMSTEYVPNASDVVKVGDEVEVEVLEVNKKKRRIKLSMKEAEFVEEVEPETEEEPPTAMEVALRQALEDTDEGTKNDEHTPEEKSKRNDDLEDILSRTLSQRVRSAPHNE
jgi:small subunit ribosomal protein S1